MWQHLCTVLVYYTCKCTEHIIIMISQCSFALLRCPCMYAFTAAGSRGWTHKAEPTTSTIMIVPQLGTDQSHFLLGKLAERGVNALCLLSSSSKGQTWCKMPRTLYTQTVISGGCYDNKHNSCHDIFHVCRNVLPQAVHSGPRRCVVKTKSGWSWSKCGFNK